MRIRWRGLELPSRIMRDDSVSTDSYARFTIEPFEQGFGTTIGNSLRRVLLSSLEGAAVTAVKIDGVSHEFSSMEGVLEDVTDILLNIKGIVLRCDDDTTRSMTLERDTAGEVRAGDLVTDPAIEVINPDHLIATLTRDVHFKAELSVGTGRGYVTASENRRPDQEIGVIPVDSVFPPVLRVRFRTEDMRVGQRTNYDRLIMEIWTNGTISPEDSLVEAGLILRKHLNPFVMYPDLGATFATPTKRSVDVVASDGGSSDELYSRSVAILNLSVRASNCLQAARIATIGELVSKTEADLLRFRSFGKTSLREVQRKLSEAGMQLGMEVAPGEAAPGDVLPGEVVPGEAAAGQILQGEVSGAEVLVDPLAPASPESTTIPADGAPADPSIAPETGPMEAFSMGD